MAFLSRRCGALSMRRGRSFRGGRPVAAWLAITGLVAFCLVAGAAPAAAAAPAANEVKAAFLCNFAEFVNWPEGKGSAGTVVIGILGEDPFGPLIDEAALVRSAPNRAIQVKRLASAEEAAEVQILFVSASESERLAEILESLRYEAVLTVGDLPDFAARGGVIGLKVEDKRVRLEVNVAAATRAGLVVSSRLLNLAQLVEDAPGGGR